MDLGKRSFARPDHWGSAAADTRACARGRMHARGAVMNHQYIALRNDGWYVIREVGFERTAGGPFRWYWLAWLAATVC